jgi:glycosyltransferase involved in cell wall biosynthesis/GT2 family glycosyltransferase
VVCTYNRAATLAPCLAALRRLDYPEYEIVVVNGPSTDGTQAVLARHPGVKRVDNPERNLGVSRNLGIAASAGEIVAFIDDDAVPDVDWLRHLAEAYEDPRVGGAGGQVIGPGGDHLQFDNGIISRYGLPIAIQDAPDDKNAPNAEWYNIMMGTNSSFRRTALEAVGGFDENYAYYHDESDVCVRIINAGCRIAHLPEARVWHEFEKSTVRKSPRDVNWQVIAKNTIYFYFANNDWRWRPLDWLQPMRAAIVHLGIFTRWFVRGEIGPRLFAGALVRWSAGTALGYAKGILRSPRRNLASRAGATERSLAPVSRAAPRWGDDSLHVVLVSQQYPPDPCGGIGVYTETLARGLVAAGHRVSVVARGPRAASVWRDGVKVHRVPDERVRASRIPVSYRVVRKNLGRSLAVHRLIERLVRVERARLVESPVWDAEAFVTSLERPAPLVIRLNTPMAIAMETQGWRPTADLGLACEMEWAMLRGASGWIDTSGTIRETLARRFGVEPGAVPVREIAFGVPPPEDGSRAAPPAARNDETRLLFVGRLEPRKGIDTLLRAAPRVLQECPRATLVVAGEPPNGGDIAEDFYRRCGVPGARERVRFLGRVDDARLASLYAATDIFVAPSRYESFGLVYLEAMARGKPVVACRAGGAASVVADGETGLLVPPDDAGALAGALVRLAGDAALRARLGAAARERVRERYGVERMVRETIEFYLTLIGRTVPAPARDGANLQPR